MTIDELAKKFDLPRGNTVLSREGREIKSIWWDNVDDQRSMVGELGVTAIIPYDENGEMACVPWIAVVEGEVITARLPAYKVTIAFPPYDN